MLVRFSLSLSLSFIRIGYLLLSERQEFKDDETFYSWATSDSYVWAASQGLLLPFPLPHVTPPLTTQFSGLVLPLAVLWSKVTIPDLLAQNRHFWLYWCFDSGIISFKTGKEGIREREESPLNLEH